MQTKKLTSILTALALSIVMLASLSTPAMASPALQDGGEVPTDEGTPPEDGENNTGDTIDLGGQKNNLGTVMREKGQPADENDSDNDVIGDTGSDDGVDDTPTDETSDTAWHHPVGNAISEFFDVPYDEVFDLHEAGNGFGNIVKAYFFANAIGIEPGELLNQAKTDGWGNVLKQNNIHPGSVGNGNKKTEPPPGTTDDPEGLDTQSKGGPPAFAGPGNNNGNNKGNGPDKNQEKNKGGANDKENGNNGKAKGKNK